MFKLIIKFLFFILVISLLLRLFLLELFLIPSMSMAPVLFSGDIIVVNKQYYGNRFLIMKNLIMNRQIEFGCWKTTNEPIINDIFVFNFPDYKSLNNEGTSFYGTYMVKRCYSVAGDTVLIKRDIRLFNSDISKHKIQNQRNNLIYPFDSTLVWTNDDYGPYWVPKKGVTINISPEIAIRYFDVIHNEGYNVYARNDSVFLNDEYREKYTFKENYYFVLGDNFYRSCDSRHWGFVPEKNIVGKAVLVLFSLDPEAPWYRKFRWNRFLKKIK